MSDRAREVIAGAIRDRGWTCEYHEPASGRGECTQCDESHDKTSTHILAALEAAGIAVVELPQPDSTDEDGLSWNDPHHGLYVPTSEELGDGLVYDAEDSMTPAEARALAAALLAAAAKARSAS